TKQRPAIAPGPRPSLCGGTVPARCESSAPAVLAAEPGVSATGAERAWLAAFGPRRLAAREHTVHRLRKPWKPALCVRQASPDRSRITFRTVQIAKVKHSSNRRRPGEEDREWNT